MHLHSNLALVDVTEIQKIVTNPSKKNIRPSFSVSYQIIDAIVQKFASFSLFAKMGDEHKKPHTCAYIQAKLK